MLDVGRETIDLVSSATLTEHYGALRVISPSNENAGIVW